MCKKLIVISVITTSVVNVSSHHMNRAVQDNLVLRDQLTLTLLFVTRRAKRDQEDFSLYLLYLFIDVLYLF